MQVLDSRLSPAVMSSVCWFLLWQFYYLYTAARILAGLGYGKSSVSRVLKRVVWGDMWLISPVDLRAHWLTASRFCSPTLVSKWAGWWSQRDKPLNKAQAPNTFNLYSIISLASDIYMLHYVMKLGNLTKLEPVEQREVLLVFSQGLITGGLPLYMREQLFWR